MITAGLYPPWHYGVARKPPPGVDVVNCVTLRSYGAAWSPPVVPPPYLTHSIACTPATIDVGRIGLPLGAIPGATLLVATCVGPPRAS